MSIAITIEKLLPNYTKDPMNQEGHKLLDLIQSHPASWGKAYWRLALVHDFLERALAKVFADAKFSSLSHEKKLYQFASLAYRLDPEPAWPITYFTALCASVIATVQSDVAGLPKFDLAWTEIAHARIEAAESKRTYQYTQNAPLWNPRYISDDDGVLNTLEKLALDEFKSIWFPDDESVDKSVLVSGLQAINAVLQMKTAAARPLSVVPVPPRIQVVQPTAPAAVVVSPQVEPARNVAAVASPGLRAVWTPLSSADLKKLGVPEDEDEDIAMNVDEEYIPLSDLQIPVPPASDETMSIARAFLDLRWKVPVEVILGDPLPATVEKTRAGGRTGQVTRGRMDEDALLAVEKPIKPETERQLVQRLLAEVNGLRTRRK